MATTWRQLAIAIPVIGAIAWALAILKTLGIYNIISQVRDTVWLYDWHVHAAGAAQLIDRRLYERPLSLPPWPLPVDVFNLPPASAAIAIPFAILPHDLGGIAWIVLGMAAVVASFLLAAWTLEFHWWWACAGVAAFLYSLPDFYGAHVVLGNINHVMLLLLVLFVWSFSRNRSNLAGTTLGLAIAIKAWPVALYPLLVREQRYKSLLIAVAIPAVSLVGLTVWQGPESLPEMVSALRTRVPVEADNPVLWTSWVREHLGAPIWLGPALAAVLLAIPARRWLGAGLGIIAGVSLIANVWDHYTTILVFGFVLIGRGLRPILAKRGWTAVEQYGAAALVILVATVIARLTP